MAINYAKQYSTYFDEAYKAMAVTRLLETGKEKYTPLGANSILVNRLTVDGAYDYNRATGWASGTVGNVFDTYTLEMDRGIKLSIDVMDANEANLQIGAVSNQYTTEVLREADAYRFGKMYADATTLGSTIVPETLTHDTAIKALDAAIAELDDNSVPMASRVLFVSNEMYQLMKQSGEIFNVRIATANNGVLNREITTFDGIPLIKVPAYAFKTAFTFDEGRFNPAVGAKALNFVLVDTQAVMAIIKHSQFNVFAPGTHTEKDGYLITSRIYHGCNIFTNKKNGIYISRKV